MTKTRDPLAQSVDAWSVQVVVASHHLLGLYRRLGDEKQAVRANQAGSSAEERCQRLGLHAAIAKQRATIRTEFPDETDSEAYAWRMLVEGQAGLSAFHALVDQDQTKAGTIRGKRRATFRGFQIALQGLRAAFPEEMTTSWIKQAIHQAADICAETLLLGLEEHPDMERPEMYQELHTSIREALEGQL